ncbi:MAG TPA: hypothetical protein VFG74_08095 [Miltoncostaeaceae bacterium]|nr:hypothetical protein [Miltoncostaeaceae bacterium]
MDPAPLPDLAAWTPLASTRDVDTAERWRDDLQARGIEAEVRLADELEAMPGASLLPGYLPATDPWVYQVHVPAADRAAALRVLAGPDIEAAPPATAGGLSTGLLLGGALISVLAALAVILVQMARP